MSLENTFQRKMKSHLKSVTQYYSLISLSGPRQAGKSTLLKMAFEGYEYLSLENPDTAAFAKKDPRGFFEKYSEGIIIDEAQKVPQLFSYLQGIVDKEFIPGRYILSGSQNYLLHRNVTQSLAGRVDISTLFPLDFGELSMIPEWDKNIETTIFNGFYPGKWHRNIPPKLFYSNYVKTYLERDVSDFIHIGNMSTFRTFLKLIAHKAGSTLKWADLSNDLNTSVNTIKSWMNILESSYIIFPLSPYYKNYGKRLVKSPKYYFYDTGLLCHLLGIHNEHQLNNHEKFGTIFENLIIAEKAKYNAHRHINHELFFFRDSNGLEIDMIAAADDNKIHMTEIKSSKTFKYDFLKNMKKLIPHEPHMTMNVIYNGTEDLNMSDYTLRNWKNMHLND